MSKALAGYMDFVWAALVKRVQTGSIVPSQRFLVEKMISPVPRAYEGEILELGAGNGAITLGLAARCPRARILACEINPVLARANRCNLDNSGINDRVQVICDAAEHVMAGRQRTGKPKLEFVISGIPLFNLSGERTAALIDAIRDTLKPGGMYIQFQYSLVDRKKIKDRFRCLRTVPVLLNIPPAVIYYASR